MFLPQEIIRRKRNNATLSHGEIVSFVQGVTGGQVSEGQVAAFCMSVFWRGMSIEERVSLTMAMADSGSRLLWEDRDHPVVDKHSTGGVGDKTSLILAPLLAVCGGRVPMIVGRGLGHTGGTWDKLESIPGYQVQLELADFQRVVREVGCGIIGQTPDLAPADGRIYAIRDTTATVESLDLITASILSKKLAAGLDVLVMDVKFGSGAFMKTREEAGALARSLESVANGAGMRTVTYLSDMNQVLGKNAGNALEVRECVEWMKWGKAGDERLESLTLQLAVMMLIESGLARDPEGARMACIRALESGAVADKFGEMVAAMGGPADFLEKSESYLPKAPVVRPVYARESAGVVISMDVFKIGMAVVALGGGRAVPTDKIDPAVGFSDFISLGDSIVARPLAMVHAADDAAADEAEKALREAIRIG